MAVLLLYAGTPLGRLTLDTGALAAGFLEPGLAYAAVAPVLRAAGDLHRARRFRRPPPPAGSPAATVLAQAAAVLAQLSLATEAGVPVPVAALDLWDSSAPGERPFLLVTWRELPATVAAPVPRHPRASEGTSAAA